jgi:protein SCO1/2
MLGILFLAFGDAVKSGLGRLARGLPGRTALALAGASLLVGLGAAGFRVAGAAERKSQIAGEADPPPTYPRLDRPAPRLDLWDQHGRALTIEAFRGRPLLVSFAYAHCQTVCPVIVHDVLAARRAVPGAVAVIVTLDPLRDTPARLPALARQWQLGADELVASGPPAAVEAVLDAWHVPRARDPVTGDITHPRLVYLVDPTGRVAYATSGGVQVIASLLSRL